MIVHFPSLISNIAPIQRNPSDKQRHEMLYTSLIQDGRIADYTNIVGLLSPPIDITTYGRPGAFKGMKVGIVGGGMSGMSAAFELRKLGFDITVFEPRTDRIGGRVYTYYFNKDKRLYGELGAARFPVSHETTWHYVNLFKLNTEAYIEATPNDLIYVRYERVRNDPYGKNIQYGIYPKFNLTTKEKNTPWPQLFTQVQKYYLSTLPPDVKKELLMILSKYDYRIEDLMKLNIRQALQQYGLSAEAINLLINALPLMGSVIYNSYESTLIDEYSLDYLNQYTISGGMLNLPLAFYNSLVNSNPSEYSNISQDALGKVNWRGGQLVTGIYKSDENGKVTLGYNILPNTEETYETFDYVILAAPLSALRAITMQPLFSGEKLQAIKDVFYQDSQKTLFLCNDRFWERQGIIGGTSYTDRIITSIQYPQDHIYCVPNCSPEEPGVLTASYSVGQDALRLGMETPKTRYEFIKRNVEMVHGLSRNYLDNVVMENISIDWYKELGIFGEFLMFLPGQREDYIYVVSTPEYDNRVFFAGEHTSPKNGWIQGALQSGMLAANNLAFYAKGGISQR